MQLRPNGEATYMLDIRALAERIPDEIERMYACTTRSAHTDSFDKLVVEFEQPDFVATVSVWENGCCDVDCLAGREGSFWHGEFESNAAAVPAIVAVLELLPELPPSIGGPVE